MFSNTLVQVIYLSLVGATVSKRVTEMFMKYIFNYKDLYIWLKD